MVALLLIMIAGGVGLSQSISQSQQVTSSWLRLGGLISLSLLSVAAVLQWRNIASDAPVVAWLFVGAWVLSVSQLTLAQLGRKRSSRVVGGLVYLTCIGCVCFGVMGTAGDMSMPLAEPGQEIGFNGLHPAMLVLTVALGAALQGGFLMTMLLGHAYLNPGAQMTQQPLFRLTVALAVLLISRSLLSGFAGLWPYFSIEPAGAFSTGSGGFGGAAWEMAMVTGRYAVGLVVPLVFVYMIYDCVRRRANQSATGILYVATVMVILGEGMAMSLVGSTGFAF